MLQRYCFFQSFTVNLQTNKYEDMRKQWLKTSKIAIASAFLLAIIACEKLEIPSTEKQKEELTEPTRPENPDIAAPTTADDLHTREDTIFYVESRGMTDETPYTVSDIRNIIPHYLEIYGAIQLPNSYISGFIVGYVPKSQQNIAKAVFSAGQVETNIILADSPDEIDHNGCIAVQLSKSTPAQKEIRDGLNLATHPENLGRFVIVRGHIREYMHAMGVKSVKDAILYLEE
jgi:hypothetical protein